MTDVTVGGPAPSTTGVPRRLVKGPQCDTCLLGQDITSSVVTNPDGRAFEVPHCFSGALDHRTGMPLTLCLNRKVVE